MQNGNKKIALFSCHNDPNYGSMLQAYALAWAIKRLGRDAEYISYTIDPVPNAWNTRIKQFAKHILSSFHLYSMKNEWEFLKTEDFAKIMEAFRNFHEKYIPHTNQIFYADRIIKDFNVDDYDNYIVGSDQSWSPYLYSPKKPYFLDFADIEHKQAYAPSMGTTDISEEYKALLKDKLSTFEHISCREKVNAKMLTELLGKEVQHVLDPTLLLDSYDWDTIVKEPKISQSYILAYILGEKEAISQFAERLGEEKHLPVFYILTRPKYLNKKNLITDAGPADFLGLIKNAEYVVTDSYHGSLFSINYNRNFYAFSKKEGSVLNIDNIRIIEFLEQLGLRSRFMDTNNTQFLQDIDYQNVNCIIQELRNASYSYLKEIIN